MTLTEETEEMLNLRTILASMVGIKEAKGLSTILLARMIISIKQAAKKNGVNLENITLEEPSVQITINALYIVLATK